MSVLTSILGAQSLTLPREAEGNSSARSHGLSGEGNSSDLSDSNKELDHRLVIQAQSGNKKAFELLVVKYQRKLLRLVNRFVHDPSEAEDVTQEAFIKAYRALKSFRNESAFYTWLYRIAVNTAKNHLVSRGHHFTTHTVADSDEAENFEDAHALKDMNTPEALLMSRQLAETVNLSMSALPEELRTAIHLREIEGMSYDEIANIMNCPIGTVRSRIFRARESIAAKLRPQLDISSDRRW
jgi:RNA polymerase sigma-70 factor (ECF subfamily)